MSRTLFVAAGLTLALLVSSPSRAQDLPLSNGAVFSIPASFEGCAAPAIQTSPNGARSYTAQCEMVVDGKPAKATVIVSLLLANNVTPRAFIEGIMTKVGKQAMIGDARMGIQPKTLKTRGKAGEFLCWVYDDVERLQGGGICALTEPSVRVAIIVSTTDAYTGMRILERVAGASTLR